MAGLVDKRAAGRTVPRMTTGWCAEGKRVYPNKQAAYYAIAKALVVAKYPAWLTQQRVPASGWSNESADRRERKVRHLFFNDDLSDIPGFDPTKWIAFVRRVAKFIQFVDDRRGLEASTPNTSIEEAYEYAESQAVRWAEAADRYRREIKRRGDL